MMQWADLSLGSPVGVRDDKLPPKTACELLGCLLLTLDTWDVFHILWYKCKSSSCFLVAPAFLHNQNAPWHLDDFVDGIQDFSQTHETLLSESFKESVSPIWPLLIGHLQLGGSSLASTLPGPKSPQIPVQEPMNLAAYESKKEICKQLWYGSGFPSEQLNMSTSWQPPSFTTASTYNCLWCTHCLSTGCQEPKRPEGCGKGYSRHLKAKIRILLLIIPILPKSSPPPKKLLNNTSPQTPWLRTSGL